MSVVKLTAEAPVHELLWHGSLIDGMNAAIAVRLDPEDGPYLCMSGQHCQLDFEDVTELLQQIAVALGVMAEFRLPDSGEDGEHS